MNELKIENLEKTYGNTTIFKGINKTVQAGEFVTLVGASGCGKTTLLKILLGSETPTKGSITIDNKPIVAEPSADRGIVFQRYSVFPHLTVLDNVLIGTEFKTAPFLSKIFGSKFHHAKSQALALLDTIGLSHVIRKYPHQLSGGMQQRLALAQSIFKAPKLLLLDEPFGALDPGIRKDMHELIHRLWIENQLTIFMVTHDIQEGFKLGSRLWVFDKLISNTPSSEVEDNHTSQLNQSPAIITYDIPLNSDTIQQPLTPTSLEVVESKNIRDATINSRTATIRLPEEAPKETIKETPTPPQSQTKTTISPLDLLSCQHHKCSKMEKQRYPFL